MQCMRSIAGSQSGCACVRARVCVCACVRAIETIEWSGINLVGIFVTNRITLSLSHDFPVKDKERYLSSKRKKKFRYTTH